MMYSSKHEKNCDLVLQGSVIILTVLELYMFLSQIFFSVCLPKMMKIR